MEEIEIKLVRLCPKCGPTPNYDANLNCTACGEHTKEEVISGEVGFPTQPMPPVSEAIIRRTEQKVRVCQDYGKELDADARFCPYHGTIIATAPVNESMIIGLAAIGGIFGIHGLGHMIMGKIVTAFIVLFVGWALIAGIVFSFIGIEDYGDPAYGALAGILAVAYIVLFVWQVIDANGNAKKTNHSFENHKVM